MQDAAACPVDAAPARRAYLDALRYMGAQAPQRAVRLVLRDSEHVHVARNVVAFSSDSSACVVTALDTVLGRVPAAVLRLHDIATISVVIDTAQK